MKKISVLFNIAPTQELKESISKAFDYQEVDSLCDNCLVISKESYIDWKYLSEVISDDNINFQFIDFYFDEVEKDRFVDSGVFYNHSENSPVRNLPLVSYQKNTDTLEKVFFLDRDGVINIDTGYTYLFDKDIIHTDVLELMKVANEKNIKVAIITNQAGVARGKFSISEVDEFHRELIEYAKNVGANIDLVEICPFHKEKGQGPWRFDSLLRKPNPGMLLRACSKLHTSLLGSIMIGDKDSDCIEIFGPEYFLIKGEYQIKKEDNVFESRSQFCREIENYLNKMLDFS
jgi:D-glycero-D-manno-heptose 1,7-bisphosphate phosphatase